MRTPFRIAPFIKRLDVPTLVSAIEDKWEIKDLDRDKIIAEALRIINSKDFVSYWEENPDLRFGQLMYNLGCSFMDYIYNYEEPNILQLCGMSPTQSNGWISVIDRDGKLLDKPIYRFIDELETSHLQKMIEEHENGVRAYSNPSILLFTEELNNRGANNPV